MSLSYSNNDMVYFREVQRTQAWALIVVVAAIPVVAVARAVSHFPGHTSPDRLMYVLGVPLVLMAVCFSLGRLETQVRDTELSIHFHWLWPERRIAWSEIRSAEAEMYGRNSYGVRWSPAGMIYNVSGRRVVRIQLRDGGVVFVGSQRAGELAEAITQRLAA